MVWVVGVSEIRWSFWRFTTVFKLDVLVMLAFGVKLPFVDQVMDSQTVQNKGQNSLSTIADVTDSMASTA